MVEMAERKQIGKKIYTLMPTLTKTPHKDWEESMATEWVILRDTPKKVNVIVKKGTYRECKEFFDKKLKKMV